MPYKNPEDRPSYAKYEQRPDIIKKRTARNKARAMLEREGKVHKGDGKDVDHKKPLSKGGATTKSNLRVKSASANRSFARKSDHSIK
jgi:Zn-dependent membrane protease YugP